MTQVKLKGEPGKKSAAIGPIRDTRNDFDSTSFAAVGVRPNDDKKQNEKKTTK